MSETITPDAPTPARRGLLARWHHTPLYLRIMGALVLGLLIGYGIRAGVPETQATEISKYFEDTAKLILGLLTAIAVPLIFVCVIYALVNAQIQGGTGKRLILLLLTNTLAAIVIGLLVANVLQPGHWSEGPQRSSTAFAEFSPWEEVKKKVPSSVIGSLAENKIIPSIIIALAFGIALRKVREQQIAEGRNDYRGIEKALGTVFGVLMVTLHWVIDLIPLAVLSVVIKVVSTAGLKPFASLAGFIVAVLTALALQACWYLLRVRLQSWVSPWRFLKGGSEALIAAFCTASSTATAPLNYTCLREKIGLRDSSASMGALVGSNFNNDGTALYEAMGPMYISQALNSPIPFVKQPVVALMAVVASVGAPGIPEAGLVTMVLVFQSVGLPTEFVAFLLPVDWFLDRCRTMVNLMGDMCVACVLDGKTPEYPELLTKPLAEAVVAD